MSGILFKRGVLPVLPEALHQHQEGKSASIKADPAADSVYVENGVIQAIGACAELTLQLSGRMYRTIDWEGAHVLPGLVDSHMHLGIHGMKLSMLDFSQARSKTEMLQMLRERAAITPEGSWILGMNWNEQQFKPAVAPDRHELDEITDRHPLFLTRSCFHAYLANSAAFREAGVHKDTPDSLSGSYGRTAEGELNGWIYEDAAKPFYRVQPQLDEAGKKAAIRRACEDALRLGLTAVHTEDLRFFGSAELMLTTHKELLEAGLFLRTHQLMHHARLEEMKALGIKAGQGDQWLKLGAVKVFADGAIGGRTALLREPYHDAPDTKGMAMQSTDELLAIAHQAGDAGFPLAVHAIGDAGAELALLAMEACSSRHVVAQSPLPHRLIHAQVLQRDLVERMSRLPLIADIQPRFVASDFPWVLERVGPERTEYLYAWKRLLEAGIVCAGGSDAPIEPLNPLLGLHAAVTRQQPEADHRDGGYLPDQKLTLQQALDLFTRGSARAAGEAHYRGSIEPGKAADFTVLDRAITGDNASQLLQAQVRMTVVNGEVAYSASI